MKRSLTVACALFFLSALLAFPQSSFLKRGQSGFGLSGTYATSSGASGWSGTAAVGLGGVFDLSLSVGQASYDPVSSGFNDLASTSIMPEITAHVIKQNSSRSPVSLSISAGFARDNYSSPDLDAESFTMWANTILVGGTVYRDVPVVAGLYLQPYAGVGYASTTLKIRNADGLTISGKHNLASFGIGLPVVYGVSGRALLVLRPGLTFDKDNTTFAISLGLVVALNKPGAPATP
ncbi:MAG: hypothetical protein ACXWHI_04600 [Candidatus Aminicenantales bacterium]